MSISEEERRAYEAGKREARVQREAPLAYLISPSDRPKNPDLAEVFDKGLRGERLGR